MLQPYVRVILPRLSEPQTNPTLRSGTSNYYCFTLWRCTQRYVSAQYVEIPSNIIPNFM